MKQIAIMAFALLCTSQIFAQNASDVLRYSNLKPSGTARYIGAGGAFGTLGEFGSISQNPAGLGLFHTDELTLTPSINFAKTDAKIGDATAYRDDKSKFGFANIGLVFNSNLTGSHWKTFNFGIGYNRQADYNRAIYYEDAISQGTIMKGFFEDYKAGINDEFGVDLVEASNTFYDDSLGNTTYDFAGNENPRLNRSHSLVTSGRMNEMVIAFAGNYEEKLMIGATVGVPFVNYRIEGEYVELDPVDAVEYFDKLTYTEYLRTSGIGVNLKLGVIYKVNQALRLGASFHTPTLMGLTDAFSNTFSYDFTDGNGPHIGAVQASPDGTADYKLTTPWRAGASAALVIKKVGFLSADVEFVDYSANRFNLTSDVASQENQQFERALNNTIQRNYHQSMNVRLGGELAIEKFRLRGGFNLLGKPEEGATDFNTAITAGIGVRGEAFFLDLGWRRGQGDGSVQAYGKGPVADTKVVTNDFLMTVGFNF